MAVQLFQPEEYFHIHICASLPRRCDYRCRNGSYHKYAICLIDVRDCRQTMLEYAYTTLSVNSNIRLLRLLPAAQTYEDELRVELIEYDVQSCDDRAHPYEALSYCWETLDKPREVLLSGRTLAITENLHAALVQLRHRAFERVLWIDAICIDQSNDREKEIQILMMGEIFAKARSVLVWLGPADERFYDPLGILRDARSQHEDPEMAQGALAQLMSRPWFTRIWVRSCRSLP